jgi:hypothetical protein
VPVVSGVHAYALHVYEVAVLDDVAYRLPLEPTEFGIHGGVGVVAVEADYLEYKT